MPETHLALTLYLNYVSIMSYLTTPMLYWNEFGKLTLIYKTSIDSQHLQEIIQITL